MRGKIIRYMPKGEKPRWRVREPSPFGKKMYEHLQAMSQICKQAAVKQDEEEKAIPVKEEPSAASSSVAEVTTSGVEKLVKEKIEEQLKILSDICDEADPRKKWACKFRPGADCPTTGASKN